MAGSASLGSLVVTLGLDAADYVRGLSRSEYETKKTVQRITKEVSSIATALTGVALVAGGAVALMVKNSIDAADAAQKMSQSAGVAIGTFTELAYAADLAGVSNEALGSSLGKLNRGIFEAAAGTGDAKKAFDALGISVKDTSGAIKNADVIMSEVAAQFAEMEDGAGKSALAMMLFGRAGAQLIPLLNSGAKGIAEAREEARQLGLTLDSETGAAAERFNDNLSRLAYANRGLANALMRELLPTLNLVTDAMVEIAKEVIAAQRSADSFSGSGDTLARTLAFIGDAALSTAALFRIAGHSLASLAAMASVPWGSGWLDSIRAIREKGQEELDRILASTRTFRDALDRVMSRDPVDNWDLQGTPQNSRRRSAPLIADTSAASAAKAAADSLKRLLEQRSKIELEVIKDSAAEKQRLLDMQYRDSLIGEQDYWRKKVEIAKTAADAELRIVNDQIRREEQAVAAAAKAKGTGSKEYYDALRELEQAQASRNKLEREFAQFTNSTYEAAKRAADEYKRSVEDINIKILELKGNTEAAARARLSLETQDLRKRAEANGDSAAIASIEEYERLATAQVQFNSEREKQSQIVSRLQLEEERIQNSLRIGAISELEALRRTGDARKQAVEVMRQQVVVMEQIARASSNPALILDAERARVELEKLESQTDVLADKFNTELKEAAAQPFKDFIKGTKTAKEAALDFLDSLHSRLTDMILEDLLSQIFNPSGTAGGGIGGVLSQVFGGGSGTDWAGNRTSGGFDLGSIFMQGMDWLGSFLPSFDVGTPYVPKTGLALVHQGERIVPASRNQMSDSQRVVQTFYISGNTDSRSQEQIAAAADRGLRRASARGN